MIFFHKILKIVSISHTVPDINKDSVEIPTATHFCSSFWYQANDWFGAFCAFLLLCIWCCGQELAGMGQSYCTPCHYKNVRPLSVEIQVGSAQIQSGFHLYRFESIWAKVRWFFFFFFFGLRMMLQLVKVVSLFLGLSVERTFPWCRHVVVNSLSRVLAQQQCHLVLKKQDGKALCRFTAPGK